MSKQQIRSTRYKISILLAVLVLVGLPIVIIKGQAKASPFTVSFVRFDRLKATTATTGRVCAKPATVATEATVKVTFPTTSGTDYVVSSTLGNWTVNTSNLDTGQTAWPGINTATNVTGKVVTFPSTDLTVGTLYCFNWTSTAAITTSSAGASETTQGNIATYTSAPALIDQSTYSESIISDDSVVVSAIVPPSFSFTLSGLTDNFNGGGNLSLGSVNSSGGKTITLLTNAAAGWIVWAKDLNSSSGKGALNSATAGNYKVTSPSAVGAASHTFTPSSEDYGLGVIITTDAAGGGTVTADAAYDGASSKAGTMDPANFRPIASANGTANNDVITLKEVVTIGAQTPAASDYGDTITFVGAGQF